MVDLSIARKAIESRYEGVCTITTNETVRVNGVTKTETTIYCEDEPCRISYQTVQPTADSDTLAKAYQEIRLFIAPEIEMPEGAKIEVTQHGKTSKYRRSGKPLVYTNHQEVLLERLETS